MHTRRHFVHLSLSAISISALNPLNAQSAGKNVFAAANMKAYDHNGLTQPIFEKHVGSLFTAFLDHNKTAYLRLDAVTSLSPKPAADKSKVTPAPRPAIATTTFSLTFDTGRIEIPQNSYVVDHGVLGRFTIFLVPGIAQSGRPTCTACFNSLS